ncbi:hypothetical protein ACFQX7_26945 [Luedemannella flava]
MLEIEVDDCRFTGVGTTGINSGCDRLDARPNLTAMSFDLILLPKPVGQSWLEASDGERKDTGEPPDPEAWDAIVAGARDVVGEVVLGEDGPSRTLTHQPSGITVRYRSGEAAINLPFWHGGADVEWLVRTMYRIGHVVADASGLVAYVPQLGVVPAENLFAVHMACYWWSGNRSIAVWALLGSMWGAWPLPGVTSSVDGLSCSPVSTS